MRIGILTFHCAHNYGAMLQCYALQETLVAMGHDVEVIDYRPHYLIEPYSVFSIKALSHKPNFISLVRCFVTSFLAIPKKTVRYRGFSSFLKKRIKTAKFVGNKLKLGSYDAYIFGSDQIWNTRLTKGFDNYFFGIFPFPKEKRLYISYAASMGNDVLTEDKKKFYTKNLCHFDAISVRENSFKKLLSPLTSKHIEVVLDPSLLASHSVWDKLEDTVKDENYVLVYQVRGDLNTLDIAKHIAKQLDAKIVILPATARLKYQKWEKIEVSPEKFVSYIKHARCVVTTSFHGTAFSVIFNKSFYCIKLDDGEDGRSKSLLGMLNLDDRMISKSTRPSFSEIDYSVANLKLEELREKSLSFLKDSLQTNSNRDK